MLLIENINKIFGKSIYSKWIPDTYGWKVSGVESVGDTYIFTLTDTNGKWGGAEIQLRREPNENRCYELWAWNMVNSMPERIYYSKMEMNTIEGMLLRLGIMLEKIIPKED
jgi:hypothetical protein